MTRVDVHLIQPPCCPARYGVWSTRDSVRYVELWGANVEEASDFAVCLGHDLGAPVYWEGRPYLLEYDVVVGAR